LKDVGLWMAVIGLESFNQRLLDFMNKGTSVEQNVEALRICKELGVRVWANVMYGLPTETNEESLETINMVKRLKPFHHSPSFYTPIHGSYLYDYCVEHDLLLSDDPAFLGSRRPTEPKIVGPDYIFLNKELNALRFKSLGWLPYRQRIRKIAKFGLRKLGLR